MRTVTRLVSLLRLTLPPAGLPRANAWGPAFPLFAGILILTALNLALSSADESAHASDASVGQGPTVQETCPVMVGNEIDPSFHTTYQGKQVFFCCKFCLEAFKKTPEKYLAKLPQFKVVAPAGPAAGHAATHEQDDDQDDHDTEHDHATGHGQPHGMGRLIRFVGKFHSVAVHFPVALIVVAALAEVLAFVTKKSLFRDAARFSLVVGAMVGIAAVAVGWSAGAFTNYPTELSRTFVLHKWLGTCIGVLLVVAAILCEVYHRRGSRAAGAGYRLILAVAVVLIGLTGHFGGILVYGPGHYSW